MASVGTAYRSSEIRKLKVRIPPRAESFATQGGVPQRDAHQKASMWPLLGW
jgi:hypothetical protein